MIRFYLVLVASLFISLGCSNEPAKSVTEKTATAKESNSTSKPVNEEPALSENQIESKTVNSKQVPDNAMELYRQAQALMKEGKFEEGYEVAKNAMSQFIEEDDDLAWMLLESIEVNDKRVEVHFNMGERERKMPDDGIVRPLSFRVWSGEEDSELSQVIDFEVARWDGKSESAAIGEKTDSEHRNYGMIEIDAPYETIRQRIIEIVSQK